MSKVVVYIHGKGGNAGEAEHYQMLFPEDKVIGFDYQAETPWEAINEFPDYFQLLRKEFDSIVIVANSIGAFLTMHALRDIKIEKAFFISPVVNMEQLILDMMRWSGVTEEELKEQGTIGTAVGETLSMEYLTWVRNHPVCWNVPTSILYGRNDHLQSIDTLKAFTEKNKNAELTVMENGEHWFHTDEQMRFLDEWIRAEN